MLKMTMMILAQSGRNERRKLDSDFTEALSPTGEGTALACAHFLCPVFGPSGGGAQCRAAAQVLRRHHVQPCAVPQRIGLHLPAGLRRGRRPAQEGRELLQRQPAAGSLLRGQEASAHGERFLVVGVVSFYLRT